MMRRGAVRKLVGKTGPVVDIATITDGTIPVGVAQDGLCVYWTTAPQGGGTGALHAAPL